MGVPRGESLAECFRCKQENARKKCHGVLCERVFHERCSLKQGVTRNGNFFCYYCQYKKRRSTNFSFRYSVCDRGYLDVEFQNMVTFIPQIGDRVIYFFQGHEEFLAKYFDCLPYSDRGYILPTEVHTELLSPALCSVQSIKYAFPYIESKKALHEYGGQPPIFMVLELAVLQLYYKPGSKEDFHKIFSFEVEFCKQSQAKIYDFLILQSHFERSFEQRVQENSVIEVLGPDGTIKSVLVQEVIPKESMLPETFWESIFVRDIREEGGYTLRRRRGQAQDENSRSDESANGDRISIWNVLRCKADINCKEVFDNYYTNEEKKRSEGKLDIFIQENKEVCKEFIASIDKTIYSNYLDLIPCEIYINKIFERIRNGFYRSEESLIFEFELMSANAHTFNDVSSDIGKYASFILKNCSNIIKTTRRNQKKKQPIVENDGNAASENRIEDENSNSGMRRIHNENGKGAVLNQRPMAKRTKQENGKDNKKKKKKRRY
eukprot:TRINITY_DN5874_c0_g1_i1.p1 TRINITY_DN5874_c0_g1~~TRINITY_DN5874_c0_g1_i1.p1  ORF type:complete len:505 (-),score=89.56 TRINITY_DN5874_c0_g1_i1:101-1576(-)